MLDKKLQTLRSSHLHNKTRKKSRHSSSRQTTSYNATNTPHNLPVGNLSFCFSSNITEPTSRTHHCPSNRTRRPKHKLRSRISPHTRSSLQRQPRNGLPIDRRLHSNPPRQPRRLRQRQLTSNTILRLGLNGHSSSCDRYCWRLNSSRCEGNGSEEGFVR